MFLIELSIAVMFMCVGSSVLKTLRKVEYHFSAKTQRVRFDSMRRMTILIIASAHGMVVFIIGVAMLSTSVFVSSPEGLLATYLCIGTGLSITSIAQILAISLPHKWRAEHKTMDTHRHNTHTVMRQSSNSSAPERKLFVPALQRIHKQRHTKINQSSGSSRESSFSVQMSTTHTVNATTKRRSTNTNTNKGAFVSVQPRAK